MLTLVTGGAASGKSAYAEQVLLHSEGTPRLYVATMLAEDAESLRRVERHRALRKGKGFCTVECPYSLDRISIPNGSAVLLECMSNLMANECFCPEGAGTRAEKSILRGVDRLRKTAAAVVIVSNELFSDGQRYDPSTQAYVARLAHVNAVLAQWADCVVEVVCGIPLMHKGEGRAFPCT